MKRSSVCLILGTAALLSACGQGERGGAGDIVTTNTGDVVLNDAQANYAFRGDNEQAVNQAGGAASANAQ